MRMLSSVVWDPKEEISSILVQLGLATLNHSFFVGLPYMYSTLKSEVLQVSEITAVLDKLLLVPHSNFKKIDSSKLDRLLHFLLSGIRDTRDSKEYQRKLKTLPLFETVHGERQSIKGCNKVFILKTGFERIPDLYCIGANGHVVLKNTLVNQTLSVTLKISALTDLEFYVKFLLPLLHTLTEKQVFDSIELLLVLKQKKTYKDYKDQIVDQLRRVKFIRDIHDTPQLASYFFDEKEPLYKIMLPRENFVPPTFWEAIDHEEGSVRRLLKELGMKHTVTDVEIIEFARIIESEAHHTISIDELKKKSSALFIKALEYNANKKSNLLNRIAHIKFVFPLQIQKKLCDYHQPFAGNRDVVAIKGSLIDTNPDHQYLIWSSTPILPTDKLCQSYVEDLNEAGAFRHPPSESVAQNLKNICQSECPNNNLRNIRKTAFCQSYAYLQSKNFRASQLQDLPVVLVENDTVLVQTSRAVLSLNNHLEFRPYLYRISPQHVLYAEFFKKIGVEERPTIRQYGTVLMDIYMDTKGKETLNANQQLTVKRAVQHLFELIAEQPKQKHFPEHLYLPSTDGKLYKSQELYFNDTVYQAKRLEDSLKDKIRLVMNLGDCYLGEDLYKHQKMLQLLPKDHQLTMLSHITTESLVRSSMNLCEYGNSCEFSGWFEKRLSSSAFLHGLTCLIREENEGNMCQDDAVQLCQSTFGRLQIICCENLETELLLGHEPLANTSSETQVYVPKEGCTFYLKHSDDMAFKVMHEVAMTLTKEINSLLQNALHPNRLLGLGELLLCDTQEEVDKTLEKYGIRNSAIKVGLHRPNPGSLIPEEWYDVLDMNFMNNYERGEYVGFKKTSEDENYYHAVIVECLPALHEIGGYCCRYKIESGKDEFVEVSSLDLYQFKREKTSFSKQSVCRTIRLVDGPVLSPEEDFPETFEEIKKEIDKCLKEIRTLSKDEQHKAIRRLYLRWHPDKNPGQEELDNKAFRYLKNKIEEFEAKETVDDLETRNFSRQNETAQSHFSWNFEHFFRQWNSEATRHRQGRERSQHTNSRPQNDFWAFQQEMLRSDKVEGKRWHLQAQCDLRAAHNDTGGEATEWCMFKVHQAVEKALMAVEYRRSGKASSTGSISALAKKVSGYSPELSTLSGLVSRLKRLGVDGKTTQYPNYHQPPQIPNNAFQPENEKEALDIALELLQKVDSYVTN
ncbi:sacsin-like [Sardina pilchardus]|uniref:sacsin-like n=1 Tax=Sardina pilchardus TaxID=27697 RepID=UPI002E1130CC